MNYEQRKQKRAEAYKQKRKEAGYTLRALAKKTGISVPTLSRFENCIGSVNEKTAYAYEQTFGEVD